MQPAVDHPHVAGAVDGYHVRHHEEVLTGPQLWLIPAASSKPRDGGFTDRTGVPAQQWAQYPSRKCFWQCTSMRDTTFKLDADARDHVVVLE